MTQQNIKLHIEKITLDGVGQLNRHQLSAVIKKELHRLLSTQGGHHSLKQSFATDQLKAKPITLGKQVREKQLGQQIANSIYRGMKR